MKMKNKQDNKTILKMANLFAPIMGSRDITISVVEEAIKKTNTALVVLDFSDIKFISRSVAHALLFIRNNLKRRLFRKKEISFINVNDDVGKMFSIVENNQTYSSQKKPNFNPQKISIDSLLQKNDLKLNI